MSARNLARIAIAVAALNALAPRPSAAQHVADVQGKIGLALPFSDLGDTHDPGFAASLGFTRWFGPRLGLHFGGAVDVLGGANASIGDVTLWHYNGGAEIDLINPKSSRARLHANAGLGATTAQFEGGGDSTDFTVNGGLNLEYQFTEAWNGLVGSDLYLIFADPDTQVVLPLQVGFRYVFSAPGPH